MTRIEVEPGVALEVQDVGEGPAVVLVGGFSMDLTLWGQTTTALIAAGYRVILLDQRGHGRSDKPRGGYDVDSLARDLVAVLDALSVIGATVVGHSFGGQVAMRAALNFPDEVGSLVLVGSNGVRASRSADYPFGADPQVLLDGAIAGELTDREHARRELIGNAFAKPPSAAVLQELLEASLALPTWAARDLYKAMFTTDMTAEISALKQPVLQVMGTFDPIHTVRAARWIAEKLTDSVLVEVVRCGHYAMAEAPEAFEVALLEFLGRVHDKPVEGGFAEWYAATVRKPDEGELQMSPAEIVRIFYAAVAARDSDALRAAVVDHFADDAVLEFPASLPYGGRLESARTLARAFVGMATAPVPVGPQNLELTDVVVDGDTVVARVTFDWFAAGVANGIPQSALEIWRFADGQVTDMAAYYWDSAACAVLAATAANP